MDINLIVLLVILFVIIWLAIKVIFILERQNQNNQNVKDMSSYVSDLINGNNTRNQEIQTRLNKIDFAQANIEKLSTSILDLQDILTDKKSRGAFGEAQLNTLVENIIPKKYALMQYTLSNNRRADCLIILPSPTKPIVIDAKFPLENFKLMVNSNQKEEHLNYKRLFKKDIKNHIDNIAERYIVPPETADSAIMFIPAEAIFSEIHAFNPDVVDYSHKKRVWLASPTTLMAILTTASAVIKDNITQENLTQIRQQLILLGQEFERFDTRIQSLFKHIEICSQDSNKIQISARKIKDRFQQINELEIQEETIS